MFEIYAYQDVDSLAGIFNAIAAMMGAGNYVAAMAVVVAFGFFVAFLAYAFAPQKLIGWQWLASVMLVYTILYVPKVQVQIVDKTGGTPPQVVANVPLGVALFGGLTSTVGNTLTELFETAFQVLPVGNLPADLTYQQHGIMFGNRMVKYTRNVGFINPTLRMDMIAFIDNCTKYDILDGTIDPSTFATSNNVWAAMSTPNPARLTPITTAPGVTAVTDCVTAYNNLNGRALADIGTVQQLLGQQLNPTLAPAMAAAVTGGQITSAYVKNQLAAAAASATDILLQNAMINAINDTSQIVGQKINDPSSLLLSMGRAQAVAQTNASWINGAKIAEETLPYFRNTIEAITYALFPIVILLLFMTFGTQTLTGLKYYVGTLLWIQLWPPVYAILNYMGSIAAAHQLAAAANTGGGTALALSTASTIYSNAVSEEAIVGYMVMSVPFIAWAAIKGIHAVGVGQLVGAGLQGMVGAASGQAALGNAGAGNMTFEQQTLGPNRTSAFMRTWQDEGGTTHRESMTTGIHAQSVLRNEGYATQTVSYSVTAQDVAQASDAAETARGDSVTARASLGADWSDAYLRGHSSVARNEHGTGTTSASFEERNKALASIDQIVHGIQRSTNMSEKEASRLAFGLSAKLVAGGSIDRSYEKGLTHQEQAVLHNLSNDQLTALRSFGDRLTHDSTFRQAVVGEGREGSELGARLTHDTTRVKQSDASYREATRLVTTLEEAHKAGDAWTYDLSSDPHNREVFEAMQRRFGGSNAAAAIATASYLASEASNRMVTPMASQLALPTSKADVRKTYEDDAAADRVNPDIRGMHEGDVRDVRGQKGMSHAPTVGGPAPTGGGVRREVEEGDKGMHGGTEAAEKQWVDKNGVVVDGKGHFHSTKSETAAVWKAADRDTAVKEEKLLELQQEASKRLIDGVRGLTGSHSDNKPQEPAPENPATRGIPR